MSFMSIAQRHNISYCFLSLWIENIKKTLNSDYKARILYV